MYKPDLSPNPIRCDFIQAFQAFWQFRETKLFFQCQRVRTQRNQRFKSQCEVEIRKREEDAAQQKLEVEAAQKDLSFSSFFVRGMHGAGTESKRV